MSRYGTNSGHGHVWARPDGSKARCGGAATCSACAGDKAYAEQFLAEQAGKAPQDGEGELVNDVPKSAVETLKELRARLYSEQDEPAQNEITLAKILDTIEDL